MIAKLTRHDASAILKHLFIEDPVFPDVGARGVALTRLPERWGERPRRIPLPSWILESGLLVEATDGKQNRRLY